MAPALHALIVEDSEDDAALLVRELRRGGFEVTHTRVAAADQMTRALDTEQWDVVISDFSMPGFSGTEALKILRAKNDEIPFLYVSGTLGEETAVTALKSGAQDYLVKGKLRRLVPAIERELREVEARRERKRLDARIHQLQRFESIGRLAGGIAHDFNNVIGAILGWAEIGRQKLEEKHEACGPLQKIQDQAQRAAGLTRQLLAYARRQVLQPQNLDLNGLIRSTTSLLERVIGENVRIELALDSNLRPIWADGSQIEQVVMNLCLNSRDAMPQGGKIRIRTKEADIPEEVEAARPYFKAGKYILLGVSDTGMGMDAETLEHIFEPFFTTKEVGKGTGLGLATVYGIVKQHGGVVDVESAPGSGTDFKIYLLPGQGAAESLVKKTAEAARRGTETILVGEDDDGLREAASEMLRALGYKVILAKDGEEAMHIFEGAAEPIDLVVLDVVMPGMSGPAAFEQMTAIKPGLRAIFVTGYTTGSDLLSVAGRKDVVVLQKPFGASHLSHEIRRLLDQSAPSSSNPAGNS